MRKLAIRILYNVGAKLVRWGTKCNRKAEKLYFDGKRLDYYCSRGEPTILCAGTYLTREGKTVNVVPNFIGYLDNLDWIVDDYYTVDNWGRVYDTRQDRGDLIRQIV